MTKRIIYLFLFAFTSCEVNKEKEVDQNSKDKVERISMLISRGSREIEYKEQNESIIPKELSDVVYYYELDNKGLLKSSYGYGSLSDNNITMRYLQKKDSIILPKTTTKRIRSFANNILRQDEYVTQKSPTDSWLVKLKVNDKTSVYYIGESPKGLKDYLYIADELVNNSNIKAQYYR